CLQDTRQVLNNKGANPVQFARGKAMIHTQGNRDQPKLTHHTLAAHVDMRRFMTIQPVEEQAIGTWNIRNRGHASALSYFKTITMSPPAYLIFSLRLCLNSEILSLVFLL